MSGLSAASVVVNQMTLVNTPPDPVELFVVDDGDATTVDLAWTESNEEYFESYRIYRSTSPSPNSSDDLAWIGTTSGTVQWTQTGLTGGPYYFVIYVYDEHGSSTASNIVP